MNEIVRERERRVWREEVEKRPKLRVTEVYVEERTILRREYGLYELTKLRGGTNRLMTEKGRYLNLEVEKRVCAVCVSGKVEDEFHFMLDCKEYEIERKKLSLSLSLLSLSHSRGGLKLEG